MTAGRAFVFGDDVNTDALAPGTYMKSPIEVIAAHCLESIDPGFASRIKAGDVVVAGRNFGAGSSREQAAEALKHLGAACVVAKSFGGIFYRNALNLGLPVIVCAESDRIRDGDRLEVDPRTGVIVDETSGERLQAQPLPEFLLDMLADGGLVPHLEKRFAAKRAAAR
jgi:3-isopropylmalate/(R)-2-methylmalate dehydratase small subunit